MGENIAGVLWKGDILQVITVTGDTLKKVLRESKQFDQADIQPTKGLTTRAGADCCVYGIKETEDGNYLIDGSLLDEAGCTRIATTNHISVGDTGYPELNDPALARQALPHPRWKAASVRSEEEMENAKHGVGTQISDLACVEMRKQLEEQIRGRRRVRGRGQQIALRTIRPASCAIEARRLGRGWWPGRKSSMDRPILAKKENPKAPPAPRIASQNRPDLESFDERALVEFQLRCETICSEVQRVTQLTGASDSAGLRREGSLHRLRHARRMGAQHQFGGRIRARPAPLQRKLDRQHEDDQSQQHGCSEPAQLLPAQKSGIVGHRFLLARIG